jgi:uncharacterized protein (TIGR00730 family)
MRRICVFCGSSSGARPEYAAAARAVGEGLAARGIGLVYGGGRVGLMGELAESALRAGGSVIGVIPQTLAAREVAHEGLTELRVVPSMHARKALMAELSDAFVALPGGLGTLEELCEVLTWAQLGIHAKPCGILNVDRYFDPLLALLDHAAREGFVKREHRAILIDEVDPGRLIQRISSLPPRRAASDRIGLAET